MMPRKKSLSTLGAALLTVWVAAPASAQISDKGMRDRYQKSAKSDIGDNFARSMESDDPQKRLEGVKSLKDLGDGQSIDYLLQALGDDDLRVRAKAIDTCGNLRANAATPVLVQQLFMRNTEAGVKRRILASLGKIGDQRAAQPIMQYLEHDLDHPTRGTAIFALGELGAEECLELLAKIERAETNPTLKRLASEAIVKVKYRQAIRDTEAKEPLHTFLRQNKPPEQR